MNKSLDQLKEEFNRLQNDIQDKRKIYEAAKEYRKQTIKQYQKATYFFNKAYREWKEVRSEAIKAQRRYKSYPREVRQWSLKHIGEIINKFGE